MNTISETFTSVSGIISFPEITHVRPIFGLYKAIPEGIPKQLELAVRDFMESSGLLQGIDKEMFYQQTLQTIAARSVMNQSGGELWLGIDGKELWTYILAHLGPDLDGRLAYTVTQAWVRKDQRGQKWIKEAWEKVRQRAKNCFAKHFIVISSRGHTKAYCRFLGKGFHPYAEILKEEI